jgi:hypothetical protein
MKKLTGILFVVLILLASVFEIRSQNMFRKVSDLTATARPIWQFGAAARRAFSR